MDASATPTPPRRQRRLRTAVALGAALLVAVLIGPGATVASAAGTLQITTPFPEVETTPGSTVKLSLSFTSTSTDSAAVAVNGLPDKWQATLRGGGFVIHAVTATADTPATVSLEITVPPDAPAGPYPFTVDASGPGVSASLPVTIDVEQVVDAGIGLTADFPSLAVSPTPTSRTPSPSRTRPPRSRRSPSTPAARRAGR